MFIPVIVTEYNSNPRNAWEKRKKHIKNMFNK